MTCFPLFINLIMAKNKLIYQHRIKLVKLTGNCVKNQRQRHFKRLQFSGLNNFQWLKCMELGSVSYWLRWGWSGGRPGSSGAGPRCSSSLVRGNSPSRPAVTPGSRSAPSCCTTQSLRSLVAASRSSHGLGPTLRDRREPGSVFKYLK